MKVIYILSAGHSGSTVLGALLGNSKNCYHAGELSNLAKVVKGELETCSCGKLPNECDFWSKVIIKFQDFLRDFNLDIESYEELRQKVEGNILGKTIDRNDFENYKSVTHKLFQIISQISLKDILVDSSKSPARALALSHVFGDGFYVIHLQRYLPDIIQSFQRKRGRLNIYAFTGSALKEYFKFIYALRKIKSSSFKYYYKDIFSQEKMGELFYQLGMENNIKLDREFFNNHVIAGNRMRYKHSFYLENGLQSNSQFSFFETLIIKTADLIRRLN